MAVVLVVAFHAGFPAITGGYIGVDVFYVISGFLITGLLFDEVERTGSIDFAAFYARRARRLLPMAMLVLVAVAVAMEFFTPPVFRPQVRFDAISAALYYSNWQFALESVNYLTLGGAQNPVLHYWSLSVEEQFYLFWPLLLLVAVRLGRRRAGAGRRIRWGAVIAIVGGCSLAYSLVATPAQPAIAYFATTTRVWEFAVGAGIALLAPRLVRLPRIAALAAGAAGLAAVVASALAYSPTTEFPGTAAIAPVLGAAAVIAAGVAGPLTGIGALLSLPPLRFIGRISYACICGTGRASSSRAPRAGRRQTDRSAGSPPRLRSRSRSHSPSPPTRAGRVAVAARGLARCERSTTALFAGLATLAQSWRWASPVVRSRSRAECRARQRRHERHRPAGRDAARGAVVDPLRRPARVPCRLLRDSACRALRVRRRQGAAHGRAARRLARRAVVPALAELGVREHFRLISWTKSGCPFAPGVHIFLPAIGRDYTECLTWQASVVRDLRALPRPAIVILGRTSTYLPQVLRPDGDQTDPGQAPGIWGAGMAAAVTTLRHLAARVAVLRDTPHAPFDVPACISWDPDSAARCDFPRARPAASDDAEYAAERKAGVPRDVYANPTGADAHWDAKLIHLCYAGGEITCRLRSNHPLKVRIAPMHWQPSEFAAGQSHPVALRSQEATEI